MDQRQEECGVEHTVVERRQKAVWSTLASAGSNRVSCRFF